MSIVLPVGPGPESPPLHPGQVRERRDLDTRPNRSARIFDSLQSIESSEKR